MFVIVFKQIDVLFVKKGSVLIQNDLGWDLGCGLSSHFLSCHKFAGNRFDTKFLIVCLAFFHRCGLNCGFDCQ